MNDWPHRRQTLVKGLLSLPPAESVLSEPEAMRPYECDGLSAYRQLPGVVCLVDSVEQVQAVLRLCYQLQVPVVPRDAGTGLSGGALPISKGCCSAGTYSILQPKLAGELKSRKLKALQKLEPEIIATANIGCLTHLNTTSEVPVVHWLELLEKGLNVFDKYLGAPLQVIELLLCWWQGVDVCLHKATL